MTQKETLSSLILPDTNWYIFGFQYLQNSFRNTFDDDFIKSLKVNKIYNYFLINNKKIIINQKVLEEIKKVCKKKKLYYDNSFIKEITIKFPGIGYTKEDLNMIKEWNTKITNPEQKFNSADMLIYILCQRANIDIIITDDTSDFFDCANIYNKYFSDSNIIKILNFDQTIKYFNINN
jgi:hypothetical protein